MFNSKPVADLVKTDKVMNDEPIPLSVLELDLPAPGEGWAAHLAYREIEIVLDDIGRAAVARGDARRLFDEQAENEAGKAEMRAAAEKRQSRPTSSFVRSWAVVCQHPRLRV